jgi:YVTN family beta-propeller protein
MRPAAFAFLACSLLILAGLAGQADDQDRLKVGVQPDGRIVVPTNQILQPAGKQVTFPGRPVDIAITSDGKQAVAKSMRELVFIDLATAQVAQRLALTVNETPRPSFGVTGLVVDGDSIWVTDAQNKLRQAIKKDAKWDWGKSVELSKPAVGVVYPAGLAKQSDELYWVCGSRANNVQLVNVASGKVEQVVPVGVAPFAVVVARDKVYVSNWGGDAPKADDPQATSSKTPIKIDPRTGIANEGTVSVIEKVGAEWKQTKSIKVGLHPSGMLLSQGGLQPGGKYLYVANANSDNVSVIDTNKDAAVETIKCRPEGSLPFGSGSNALAINGDHLYVANGTNNCIAVIRLGTISLDALGGTPDLPKQSQLLGLIPTAWYPGGIAVTKDGKQLVVANIKGHGSLAMQRISDAKTRAHEKGHNSHDHLGSVSIIDIPDGEQLKKYTDTVNANNRLTYSLTGLEKPRPDAKPQPVPERHGEPSVFKHIIYVVKENRTYDQVFGDMKEGNGDPTLTIFGEQITPNHHALARQFTLFDNFYCSGVLSADGHNWVNEAYVTDYLERSFGAFNRSYPDDGTDPLAQPATGHLWDNALSHKKTIRIYGEYVETIFPRGATWKQYYDDWKNGTSLAKVESKATIKALEPYTHPAYPWFPLLMPDVLRARLFIEELKGFEQKGTMPSFITLTLPVDHCTGTRPGYPTPKASVADNDLALGQLVEAVSKSKFWPETCILVVEDDPQNGYDHVDGHRTVALVISPYTKRKFVDSTNYNQTGMVKTIELMLGLPPMNQLDLSATPMRNCFQATPDLTPYTAVPNQVPLDEMNPSLASLTGKALYWAKKSLEIELEEGDAADEDTFNRILWHAMKGYDTPYPERFTGTRVRGE